MNKLKQAKQDWKDGLCVMLYHLTDEKYSSFASDDGFWIVRVAPDGTAYTYIYDSNPLRLGELPEE